MYVEGRMKVWIDREGCVIYYIKTKNKLNTVIHSGSRVVLMIRVRGSSRRDSSGGGGRMSGSSDVGIVCCCSCEDRCDR